jgi:Na+-transporting NADH:ubiquinone oxidoreductase subunit NqrF
MSESSFLEALKPGDLVIVTGEYGSSVRTVERLTDTKIIVLEGKNGMDKPNFVFYNRKTGNRIPRAQWHTPYLSEAIPELVSKVTKENRRKKILHILHDTKWKELTDEQLDKFYTVLAEIKRK